jgi:hypothetical protein
LQLILSNNILEGPAQLIVGKDSALEIWSTLVDRYKRVSDIQLYSVVRELTTYTWSAHESDRDTYATKFNESARKIEELKKTDAREGLPILFIMRLEQDFLVFENNQRQTLKKHPNSVTLESLTSDLSGEIFVNKEKPQDNGKDYKMGDKKNITNNNNNKKQLYGTSCKYFKAPNSTHKREYCFAIDLNEEKGVRSQIQKDLHTFQRSNQ